MSAAPRRRSLWWWALAAYVALLAASHVVVTLRDPPAPPAGPSAQLPVVGEPSAGVRTIRMAYRRWSPADRDDAPAIVLIHGSPGSIQDFGAMSALLGERYDVIAPDLPGFGRSEREVPDYSTDAHAQYVLELMDALDVHDAHVVAFSMGGAVAVGMAERAPERVRSISMVSAIGVQELELFGSYRMNHVVHAAQLALIRVLRWGFPHFGAMDGALLGEPYARNFADTDQRPLRGMLERYAGPMQIVHGRRDFLVPPEAATEHHRIVPQSELHWLPEGHFVLFTRTEEVAELVGEFVGRVESGDVPTRAQAAPERVAAAAEPFDPATVPEVTGVALWIVIALLVASAFVSEDLTCIGAGLLAAQGRLDIVAAMFACWLGNFLSDVALYVAGRWLGRPVITRRPMSWVVDAERLDRAEAWFARRKARAIFVSRFVPGLRLPTYFAAGVLRASFVVCTLYFAVACAIWTPIIVGFSAWVGTRAYDALEELGRWGLPAVVTLLVLILLTERVLLRLVTHRGRRLLLGSWRRLTQWEFWPPWAVYPPIVLYVAWLAVRHRGLALVTAVNPAIPSGGLIGESKSSILGALRDGGAPVPVLRLLPASLDAGARTDAARAFMRDEGVGFPVVVKPDVGERGSGVHVVHDDEALAARLAESHEDMIVQAYAPGQELGVFWYRYPGEERGHVYSIVEKLLPEVVGDGERTLERLILDDPRAVCMAEAYLHLNAERVDDVPAAGERVAIARIGTHCRGAIFLDGSAHRTPELEAAFDRASAAFPGFHFGRYDVRVRDLESFRRGEGFQVIELNGLTSEAAHVYDPAVGIVEAYRVLLRQWRIAFEIAAENVRRGAEPMRLREALARVVGCLRR